MAPGCAWWGQGLPAALLGETSEVETRASKHTHFPLLGEPCPSLGVTHSLRAQGYHARMGKPRSGGRRELGQVTQLPLRARGGWKVKAWDSEQGAPLNPSGPTWVLEDLTPSQRGLLRLAHTSPLSLTLAHLSGSPSPPQERGGCLGQGLPDSEGPSGSPRGMGIHPHEGWV